MLGVIHYPTYALGALLIVLLPGPNSLYVLSTAARAGIATGYRAACGVFLGDTVLITLTSLGAASLLRTTPVVFDAVKLIGAVYLLVIGYGMLKAARDLWRDRHAAPTAAASAETAAATAEAAEAAEEQGSTSPFRRALLISLLNPKAILFLLSFFVQFVDPSYAHTGLSFAVLGGTVQFFSFLYLSTLILAGHRLAAVFRARRRLSAGLTTGVAALFIGFAAKLATASAAG
ncbi:leucine efflux protein LeuE [Streptacidiphilus jiangxiensis]|uniref:Leucine efflux protein n=1 Tax=Streptacidiphilus jiangxiensis TaxID=235985 RepID=A0A1H7PX33_STRJI|nr:leucine efflux protein LeuE [Streptacidiphilus jiangxiensis]SEL39954.1 leucine efflux protein [Streptacidiphilus jiangxiensis]